MNGIEILHQMHEEAKSAFQRLEQADPGQRLGLWDKLQPELVVHEQVEEKYVYHPVAQEVGSRDDMLASWDLRHHEQVLEAEGKISKINMADPLGSEWLDLVRQLKMTLEQHIQTEEQEIWPRIQQTWGADKLDHAGAEIQSVWNAHKGQRIEPAA
jgi:hemerythrin-like domain-containing protein